MHTGISTCQYRPGSYMASGTPRLIQTGHLSIKTPSGLLQNKTETQGAAVKSDVQL